MVDIYISNKRIETVFQLLGNKEDDISYSVGWALAQSEAFLSLFLQTILKPFIDIEEINLSKVSVHLQKAETANGRTDFEIHQPGLFFLILEAKRGWLLPDNNQLAKYSKRAKMVADSNEEKKIIAVSECSNDFVNVYFNPIEINNVEVLHFSWAQFYSLSVQAARNGSHAEKRLLNELNIYLKGIMSMQNLESNWVYVVSLGYDNPTDWKISWRDIVNKKSKYFHPFGSRWPKIPPNYIAFRFDGKLQSIHFIEKYEITKNLSKHFTEAPETMADHDEHFLYQLGSPIFPQKPTPTGKGIPRSARVWCMFDTLLTCPTITEALAETKRRNTLIEN